MDEVSGSRPRVLVVDDEKFVCKIARRVLERHDIEVLVAEDGTQALQQLGDNPDIALVLLDSSLPDMNAERILELMRARNDTTPVLLSSGFGAHELPSSDDFANVVGFLAKPYPVAKLSEMVRAHLDV